MKLCVCMRCGERWTSHEVDCPACGGPAVAVRGPVGSDPGGGRGAADTLRGVAFGFLWVVYILGFAATCWLGLLVGVEDPGRHRLGHLPGPDARSGVTAAGQPAGLGGRPAAGPGGSAGEFRRGVT